MAYSTIQDIETEISGLNFDSVTPAVSQVAVQGFIDQEFLSINSMIGVRYVLPITLINNPISFNDLKLIEINIVVERVLLIINSSNAIALEGFSKESESRPYSGIFKANKSRKMLTKFSIGTAQLIDATRKKSRVSGNVENG